MDFYIQWSSFVPYPTSETAKLHSSPVFGTTFSKTNVSPWSSTDSPVKFASLQDRNTFASVTRLMKSPVSLTSRVAVAGVIEMDRGPSSGLLSTLPSEVVRVSSAVKYLWEVPR